MSSSRHANANEHREILAIRTAVLKLERVNAELPGFCLGVQLVITASVFLGECPVRSSQAIENERVRAILLPVIDTGLHEGGFTASLASPDKDRFPRFLGRNKVEIKHRLVAGSELQECGPSR